MKSTLSLFATNALLFSAMIAPMSLGAQELNPGNSPGKSGYAHGHRPNGVHNDYGTGSGQYTNGIIYNGGPVILNTVHIYYIFYGTWDAASMAIPTHFANGIGGSPYFNINTSYFNGSNQYISNSVSYGGFTTDNYSKGTSLTDSSFGSIVSSALSAGKLPTDTNGVYFVLTSPDVNDTSGFTTSFCGWHTWGTLNGANIKYSFVGNSASINAGACSVQTTNSPNGNPGVDAMISVIAHELQEATTDPNLNAWYDSLGYENADKCAWTFGTTYSAANGSVANMNLGGYDFLIQQNWVNAAGGYCALSYASSPDFSLTAVPTSRSTVQGGTTASYVVNVTPISGFGGTVDFTLAGLPAGVTANPNPPASSTTSTSFTISVPTPFAAGTYPFTITGKNGALTHTINASLVVAAPDFSFTLSGSQSVSQGGTTGSYAVTLTPTNGFSSAVNWSVTGLPTGATTTLPSSTTASTSFTVTVPLTAAPNTYTLTVKGISGSLTHTATTTLVVTPSGTFTLLISPDPLTVKRGSSGNYTVTVTPVGTFNSSVQLSVSGLPNKATGSFSLNPVIGGSWTSTLKITVSSAGSKAGSSTITVKGVSGTLSAQKTATLTVN